MMEERRKHPRYDPSVDIVGYFEVVTELTGRFRNHEPFVVKNISLGGFNLLTNFAPTIGLKYPVFLEYAGRTHQFLVRIIQSSILSFDGLDKRELNDGMVYSVGVRIEGLSKSQKEVVLKIIQQECRDPDNP